MRQTQIYLQDTVYEQLTVYFYWRAWMSGKSFYKLFLKTIVFDKP
jgi:hypothetical protein